ncbi:hypothetical protein H0H87_008263 [Tephrocybe sp. NHM501043]|nr:hypothetical protein H0H87_008263 [Tephrocybe sp. NHM501043]
MSAYGPIKRAEIERDPLPTKKWTAGTAAAPSNYVTTHHLTISSARSLDGLLDYLSAVFAKEVDDGFTYPQEGEIDRPAFDSYFFAADVLVAIVGETGPIERTEGDVEIDINTARGVRPWNELWERLGFTRAGLIPRAGRLKKKDGQGEEYMDAYVFYKSFVEAA